MGEKRDGLKIRLGKMKERDNLEDINVGGRMIQK
jgi:hypothetical protein